MLKSIVRRLIPFRFHGNRTLSYKDRTQRLVRSKQRFRFRRKLKAWLPSASVVPSGVNLIAYIRADMGLGVTARGMAAAMEAADIEFNIINIERGNPSRHGDYSWIHKEVRRSDFDITIACLNPDNSIHLKAQAPAKLLGHRYAIGQWVWELSQMPDEWLKEFDLIDEVWAPSRFVRDAIAAKSPVPVVHIPHVVHLSQTRQFSRTELGLPSQRFLFLAMFDTRSVLQRKNPLGVLAAFKKAFPSNDPNVTLILKFNNPDCEDSLFQALREETSSEENVMVINRIMDRDEVNSLILTSDCFVSLHRAEGFGLGPAEAMSVGKPVIVTNWSGNTDYMTSENSVAIEYQLVKLGQDYGPYKADQYWAEPNIDQAAYWMKQIFCDAALAKRIGARGQETINAGFSPAVVGRKIRERLDYIRRNN